MMRSAISPRLAMSTFLNMRSGRPRSGGGVGLLEAGPARIAGTGDALHAQRKFARARRVEDGAVVGNCSLRVEPHERLVEALHPVLHRAFLDQVRDVQR